MALEEQRATEGAAVARMTLCVLHDLVTSANALHAKTLEAAMTIATERACFVSVSSTSADLAFDTSLQALRLVDEAMLAFNGVFPLAMSVITAEEIAFRERAGGPQH